jgi:uncharacterized protein (DUF1810 family)
MDANQDPFDLERFLAAQDPIYSKVTSELRQGRKQTHWIWFVFPQIDGLGSSAMARRYAIRSRQEAAAYLTHRLLGNRLLECTELVLENSGKAAIDIFGSPDDVKFRSSMTLFAAISARPIFQAAIERFYDGCPDEATLVTLGKWAS